jgi:hypothetical protein
VTNNAARKLYGPALPALLVVLALANAVFLLAPEPLLLGWVNYLFMAATPAQIVIALLLRGAPFAGWDRLPQPGRGLRLLGLNLIVAAIIAPLWMIATTGTIAQPGPQLTLLTIVSVAVTLWVVPLWHGWPATAWFAAPWLRGAAVLAFSYLAAFLVFRAGFDFAFLKGAPVYLSRPDPGGAFSAFAILSFLVTSIGVILGWALCDFHPIGGLAQPWRGFALSSVVLVVTLCVFVGGTRLLALDPLTFMVRIPVCFIFGTFIVNNLLQHRFLADRPQPERGVLMLGAASAAAVLAYWFYTALAGQYSSAVPGDPSHGLETWMATAILGVTFPIFIVVTEYFAFWPFVRQDQRDE